MENKTTASNVNFTEQTSIKQTFTNNEKNIFYNSLDFSRFSGICSIQGYKYTLS